MADSSDLDNPRLLSMIWHNLLMMTASKDVGWKADKQQWFAETPEKRQIGPPEYIYFTKSAGNLQTASDTWLSSLSGSCIAVLII